MKHTNPYYIPLGVVLLSVFIVGCGFALETRARTSLFQVQLPEDTYSSDFEETSSTTQSVENFEDGKIQNNDSDDFENQLPAIRITSLSAAGRLRPLQSILANMRRVPSEAPPVVSKLNPSSWIPHGLYESKSRPGLRLKFSSMTGVDGNPQNSTQQLESPSESEIEASANLENFKEVVKFQKEEFSDGRVVVHQDNNNNNEYSSSNCISPECENNISSEDKDTPPPHEQVAKMARFIVHHSNWASVATLSTRPETSGFPFSNIFSISDGTVSKSSGTPYMYMTPLDLSAQDLQIDKRMSMSMSLVQGDYCQHHSYDPEDPRCAKVILSGHMKKVSNGTLEEEFAREALFSRHPAMETWPKDHDWFFGKLAISNIVVLDYFGGPKTVSIDDYYKALS